MLVALAGCSFVTARVPDRPPASRVPEDERFECRVIQAPIIDTALAFGLAAFIMNRELDFMPDPMADPVGNLLGEVIAGTQFQLENAMLGLTAAALFASTIYGFAQTARCYEAQGRFEADRRNRIAEREAFAVQREEAYRLTKIAASAARNGSCADVKGPALDVSGLDREFYEIVFVRDVAIARCLDLQPKPVSAGPLQLSE